MILHRETWRLIETWDAEPGFNMALDEALLLGGEPRPTLRFYTWLPDALSLGYFQRWEEVREKERVSCVVRRLTGGGAIHHRDELTFSITASCEHPLYRGPVQASYERVHAALAAAFAPLGVRAAMRGEGSLGSDRADSGMCFRRSTPLDLAWDGAKGVGTAQRRTRGRVLHHGSIKLDRTDLEGPIATLRDHAPGLTARDLAALLVESLSERFGMSFQRTSASADELARAHARAGAFGSEAFLRWR